MSSISFSKEVDGYVAPLLDKQEAPLVAIVDTSKIVTQLVKSLGEPINLLIDEGFVKQWRNIAIHQKA
jgi:hypothetical protein